MSTDEDRTEPAEAQSQDEAIRAVVTRLSRPHSSGGTVIERAAILASGADATAIVAWIIAHAGQPEAPVVRKTSHGLYGAGLSGGRGEGSATPSRYVLPVGALT